MNYALNTQDIYSKPTRRQIHTAAEWPQSDHVTGPDLLTCMWQYVTKCFVPLECSLLINCRLSIAQCLRHLLSVLRRQCKDHRCIWHWSAVETRQRQCHTRDSISEALSQCVCLRAGVPRKHPDLLQHARFGTTGVWREPQPWRLDIRVCGAAGSTCCWSTCNRTSRARGILHASVSAWLWRHELMCSDR